MRPTRGPGGTGVRNLRPHAAAWLLVLAAFPGGAAAQMAATETDDLRLLYIDPTQRFVVPHVARGYTAALEVYRPLFGWDPWERTTVILADLADQGGGSASAAPRNRIMVNIAPLNFAFETMPPGERMVTIMNHELLHVLSMDQAGRSDRFFRRMFWGKVVPEPEHPESILYLYLTAPRTAVPRWYQEGSAIFFETWLSGGLGRAQGAWDEMVFRAKVRDETGFYDPLGLVSEGIKIDFQAGANSYLYGTRFLSYLAWRHSPQSVVDWVSRTDGGAAYYADRFREVFGVKLKDAWSEWVEFEHEFQEKNLERIRQYATTPYEDLSPQALGSMSRPILDREAGEILAAFNYPGVVAHVGAISLSDGTVERILEVKGPAMYTVTSLAYDPATRAIYYTSDNGAHRDLRVVPRDSRKSRVLLKDARIGDLAFNPTDRSLWGIRHFNAYATLVRIPDPHLEWEQVHTWPFGEIPYDLDLSPDGTLLSASMALPDGRHTLRVYRVEALLAGDAEPMDVVEFGTTIPSGFVFSPDGTQLYGSSYYTGVSNIFRYDLATRELDAMSNSETGFFRPIPMEDGSAIVFRYTGEGFVPARVELQPLEDLSAITFLGDQIAKRYPVVGDWTPRSLADVPLDSLTRSEGPYRSLREVGLESVYPIIEGYKDFPAYGFALNLSDPLYLNRFRMSASYTPNSGLPSEERLHFELDYRRYNWRARATWNDADFYDLFGPTKTGRKGYTVGGGYTKYLIWDEPRELRVDVDGTFFGRIDTLPRYQNVAATVDQLVSAVATFSYSNRRASLGAVEYEKGLAWDVFLGAEYVDGDLIPGVLGNVGVGVPLPLAHSSVWFWNAAGTMIGELDDPFANFFFGGFGNNWVDHGSIKRYHEYYSFPGVELNSIGGRTFVKSMVEWNLPPLRFERAGWPGFFLTWMRPSVFVGGIQTDLDPDDPSRRLGNAGVQLDFRLGVLSTMKMTFSLGYAAAFEKGTPTEDEVMFSLSLLH